MSQNKKYYKIYNFKEIYSEFESHLTKKDYEDSDVNKYIKDNMNKYFYNELEIMKETTLKHKERKSFEGTVAFSALSAIFTLLAILVAIISVDKRLQGLKEVCLIIILFIYVLLTTGFAFYLLKESTKIIRTENLLDITIRLRKSKI
ncbi:hypothetical protein ABNX05_12785 [Lysinibacillus sp. M3]|uniref:Uncharacterized protein n=1 Tax=Lysinibacillus zambalensis TaxID=3160866 RepID=A0ABV1MSK8_9BACI